MDNSENKDFTESTRPGTVYRVFEQYKKAEYNECGEKYVFLKPEVVESKKKTSNLIN